MPTVIERVIKLVALNRSVIPSGGGATKKAPIVDWMTYQKQMPTIEQILQWDDELHPTLWGIVTGQISGVVVFDTDAPEAFKVFDDAKLYPHVETKRGRHYYFKHPGKPVGNKAGIIPHLDFRGDGGFVNCLGENENASYKMIIPPEDHLLYDMKNTPQIVKEAWIKSSTQPSHMNKIGDTIVQSTRNQTLASLAGSMRSRGLPLSAIQIALIDANKQLCKPPLPESEVLSIAKSISRYQPTIRTNQSKGDNKWICPS